MTNRTYRLTEIVGTSPEGIDNAIRNGVAARGRPSGTSTGSRSSRSADTSVTAGRPLPGVDEDRLPARGRLIRRLAGRRQVEVLDCQRRDPRPGEPVCPLPREAVHCVPGVGDAVQHPQGGVVEPEVPRCPDHLSIPDDIDPVAGQAGEQEALGVDLTDVPEAGHEQAVADPGRKFVKGP